MKKYFQKLLVLASLITVGITYPTKVISQPFSKSKISVEGATAAVVPSIPKLIADISNDIRTGSVEKFKISLGKESLTIANSPK